MSFNTEMASKWAYGSWLLHTWFPKVMDIRISGMFLNSNQLNKRGHLDETRHNELLAHLPMLWQQRSVDDSDRFDDESTM